SGHQAPESAPGAGTVPVAAARVGEDVRPARDPVARIVRTELRLGGVANLCRPHPLRPFHGPRSARTSGVARIWHKFIKSIAFLDSRLTIPRSFPFPKLMCQEAPCPAAATVSGSTCPGRVPTVT